jgi:hypothetical protein
VKNRKVKKKRQVRTRAPGGGRKRLAGQEGPRAVRCTITLTPQQAQEIENLDPTCKQNLSSGVRFLYKAYLTETGQG